MFLLCVSFTAEIGPGVVPGQLSVDGSQQLRLDLHDAGYRRTFRQHSLPCQDHVGKLVEFFCLASAFTSESEFTVRVVYVAFSVQVDSSRPYFC